MKHSPSSNISETCAWSCAKIPKFLNLSCSHGTLTQASPHQAHARSTSRTRFIKQKQNMTISSPTLLRPRSSLSTTLLSSLTSSLSSPPSTTPYHRTSPSSTSSPTKTSTPSSLSPMTTTSNTWWTNMTNFIALT